MGARRAPDRRQLRQPRDADGSKRLKRGTHRVRVSISSGAGTGRSVSKSFRVR